MPPPQWMKHSSSSHLSPWTGSPGITLLLIFFWWVHLMSHRAEGLALIHQAEELHPDWVTTSKATAVNLPSTEASGGGTVSWNASKHFKTQRAACFRLHNQPCTMHPSYCLLPWQEQSTAVPTNGKQTGFSFFVSLSLFIFFPFFLCVFFFSFFSLLFIKAINAE